MRGIKDVFGVVVGWAPVAVSATKTSAAIDLANALQNLILIEPGLWTDGTHTFTMTDSADNTTYAAVAAGDLLGTFSVESGTASALVQKVSYIGSKRYIKIIDTVATGTTGAILGVTAIVRLRKQP